MRARLVPRSQKQLAEDRYEQFNQKRLATNAQQSNDDLDHLANQLESQSKDKPQ